jgi:hypothetical protein
MNREEIAQGCLDQAGWAAKLGSPMYEALLRRMAENVRTGGPCLAALEPHKQRSRMLAPLLLLAAIHRMVLEGQLPAAARSTPRRAGRRMRTRCGRICSKPFRAPCCRLACKPTRLNVPAPCYRDSSKSCGSLACRCGYSKSAQAPA